MQNIGHKTTEKMGHLEDRKRKGTHEDGPNGHKMS